MPVIWLLAMGLLHGIAPGALGKPCGDTVLSQDFSGFGGDPEYWHEGRGGELFPGFLDQASSTMGRLEIGNGEAKIEHQEGCIGAKTIADDGNVCGLLMQAKIDKPLTEATLTYKIKFSENYDWTAGGKLPGLCSDECLSGCKRDGTIGHSEGWSNRLMWRSGGNIVSYTYYPGQVDCGVDLPWAETLTSGKWYELKLYLKLNEPGKPNGVQKAWVNGDLVWVRSNLKYRNVPGHEITRFVWQTFHGGNPNSPTGHKFAPSMDQQIWFDDFIIQDGECPPDGPEESEPSGGGGGGGTDPDGGDQNGNAQGNGQSGDDGQPQDNGQPQEDGQSGDDGQPQDGGQSGDNGQPQDDIQPQEDGQPQGGGQSGDGGQTQDDAQPEIDGHAADGGQSGDDGQPQDGGQSEADGPAGDDRQPQDDGQSGADAPEGDAGQPEAAELAEADAPEGDDGLPEDGYDGPEYGGAFVDNGEATDEQQHQQPPLQDHARDTSIGAHGDSSSSASASGSVTGSIDGADISVSANTDANGNSTHAAADDSAGGDGSHSNGGGHEHHDQHEPGREYVTDMHGHESRKLRRLRASV